MAAEVRVGVPELTRRGWALIGASGGLLVGGILLGAPALAALAVGGGVAVLLAALWVSRRRSLVSISRFVDPPRLTVGRPGRVLLAGQTRTAIPWLSVTESVDEGKRAARFVLVPLAAGTAVRAAYRVPTERRGRHIVGPTLLTYADPCGLVRRTWSIAESSELLVHPRVHDVVPPRRGGGGEPNERATGPRVPVAEALGEFLALREYEPGDDPRRVHWRSTARQGELLVRVDDAPAPGRAVILLDTRPDRYPDETFEAAIEAVASVAAALFRSHQATEIVTVAGETLRPSGPSALDRILDRLAVLEPEPNDNLAAVTAALRKRFGVGGIVVVTGAADREIIDAAAALRRRRAVTLVVSAPGAADTGSLTVVDITRQPFPAAWNAAVRSKTRWQPANSPSRLRSAR